MKPPTRVQLGSLLTVEAILLAVAASAATYVFGDLVSRAFDSGHAMKVIIALLVWFFVAWAARKLTVGPRAGIRFKGPAVIAFGLLRLGLLFGLGLLVGASLIAVVMKAALASTLIHAAILLMMTVTFTGIAGGATVNSMVVANRGQKHSAK